MLTSPSASFSKEWRGIVPLHSTCEDVKRLLGVTTCESSTYYLKDEIVSVGFSEKPCHEKWPYERWNVPPNTVTSIGIRPKKHIQITDLAVDTGKFEKAVDEYSTGGHVYYSEEEGMTITADAEGKVLEISYLPAAKDSHFRCRGSSVDWSGVGKRVDVLPKFDEYGDIAFNEEKVRLDKVALQFQRFRPDPQGYIIAYSGRLARVGEAQARAERAKNYLVNTHDIEAARIVTVDGGYREKLTVELFVGPRGMAGPSIEPTVHPSEVQVIKNGRATSNNRRSYRPRRKQR